MSTELYPPLDRIGKPPLVPIDLKDYLSFLVRRKRTILVVSGIVTVLSALVILLIPPTFTAGSTLLVKFGREFIYRSEVGGPETSPSLRLSEIVNSEVEILKSRDLAEKVIGEIGLATIFPDRVDEDDDPQKVLARAVSDFGASLSVVGVLESSIIKISFEHPDPQIAARALNLLVERFKEKHLEIFGEKRTDSYLALLTRSLEKLASSEDELSRFKEREGIIDAAEQQKILLGRLSQREAELFEDGLKNHELKEKLRILGADPELKIDLLDSPPTPDRKEALAEGRKDLLARIRETDMKIIDLEGNLSLLKEQSKDPTPSVPAVTGDSRMRFMDDALVRLLDLELKEKDFLRNYREESREVQGVRNSIQQIENFLVGKGSYVQTLMNHVVAEEVAAWKSRRAKLDEEMEALDNRERRLSIAEAAVELALLENRQAKVAEEIGSLKVASARLDEGDKRMQVHERKVALNEKEVDALMEKYQEALIADELDKQKMVSVKVIESASPPILSAGPSRKIKFAIGAFIGLLAGAAVAFILELMKP